MINRRQFLKGMMATAISVAIPPLPKQLEESVLVIDQIVKIDIREMVKAELREWYNKKMDELMLHHLAGGTEVSYNEI